LLDNVYADYLNENVKPFCNYALKTLKKDKSQFCMDILFEMNELS